MPCPGGASNPCYGHGTCDDGNQGTATCACQTGYLVAFQCERPCNGGALTPCSGHGTCDPATGACTCIDDDIQVSAEEVRSGERWGEVAASVCPLRQNQMEQGPTEPHAGRSTFLLSSGGAGGGYC